MATRRTEERKQETYSKPGYPVLTNTLYTCKIITGWQAATLIVIDSLMNSV